MAKTAGSNKKSEGTESKAKKTTLPKEEKKEATRTATSSTKAKASGVTASTKAPKAKKVKTAAKDKVGRLGGRCCKMKDCKRTYKAKGYCGFHYKEWRHGAYGKVRYKACKDTSCFKPMGMNRHGFCEDHFQNYYVKGIEQAKVPAAEKPAAKKVETPPAAAAG